MKKIDKKDKEKNSLSDKELKIIYYFVDNGGRLNSYRKFIKEKKTDYFIYNWFNSKKVQEKIIEIGQELSIYDTVSDKVLIQIISNPFSKDVDKINAIKTWNDLRKRTTQQIQLSHTANIDFSNISDENLENIVKKIIEIDNEQSDS